MTTTLAAAHPMPMHHIIRKTVIGVILLAAASAGLYEGAQAVTAHFQQPTSNVSYANEDTIARTIQGANHSPAAAGDFIDAASISTPDVVSVVKAVH